MRLSEFVKSVQLKLDRIKDYNSGIMEPEVFLESQRAAEELQKLLIQYSDSDVVIQSENDLAPFTEFLSQRRNTMAIVGTSYKLHPKAKGNLYCEALADSLLLPLNQIRYEPRKSSTYLMPPLKMHAFAKTALHELDFLQEEDASKYNPYVYLESQVSLVELKALLKNLLETPDENISLAALSPIFKYLQDRWKKIEGTEADFRVNPNTDVNIGCDFLTRYMLNVLVCNNANTNGVTNPEKWLMPSINPNLDPSKPNDRLKQMMFARLKQEENLRAEEQFLTSILRKSEITIADFAWRLLAEMDKMEEEQLDNIHKYDLMVYLESRHAMAKLRELLEAACESKGPISISSLSPFISFLQTRWDLIDGTKASYNATYTSNANQFCQTLSEHLSMAGFQIDYRNRNPKMLLAPKPHHNLDEVKAAENLRLSLLNDLKNQNDLITEILTLDKAKWNEYLKTMDLSFLVKLLSNGKATIPDLLTARDMFNDDESYDKAVLFCEFEACAKEMATPQKGFFGGLFSGSAPTNEQKAKAIMAVQQYLQSDAKLSDFFTVLNSPQSELNKHKKVLEDASLSKFVDQIKQAISKLPVVVAQEEVVEEKRLGVVSVMS